MQTTSGTHQSPTAQPAVRTRTTTFWLWLVLLLNTAVGLFSFVAISSLIALGMDTSTIVMSVIAAILSLIIAIGAFLILQWKKIGFYIITGCVAVNVVLSFMGGGNVGTAIFGAILSLGILYYVLQYPKENKAWNHLA